MAYWRDFPPTHILVRAIAVGLGVYKPKRTPGADEEMSDAELRATIR
jgi:hypothetical protein